MRRLIAFFLLCLAIGFKAYCGAFLEGKRSDIVGDTTAVRELLTKGKMALASSADSAVLYYQRAISMAESKLSQGVPFQLLVAEGHGLAGDAYWRLGNNDNAVEHFIAAAKGYHAANKLQKESDVLNRIGVVYSMQSKLDMAVEYFHKFLEVGLQLGDSSIISRGYNNLGLANLNRGEYALALDYFHKAIAINESTKNLQVLGGNYSNVGNVHKKQGNLSEALSYYSKALDINIAINNKQYIAGCHNNIGAVYADLARASTSPESKISLLTQTLNSYQKGLEVAEALSDKRVVSMCLNNMGLAYFEVGKVTALANDKLTYFGKAVVSFLKSENLKLQMGDINGLAIVYENLTNLYLQLAKLHKANLAERQKSLIKALKYAEKSMDIATKSGSAARVSEASLALMRTQTELGLYSLAIQSAEVHLAAKDSLFSKEKSEALANAEAKYQAEKKQQEIDQQSIVIEKQQLTRNALVGGIVLALLLLMLLFILYRNKRWANLQISAKNKDLEDANYEILAQRDEIEAQRDMVISQRDKLEDFSRHITDSLQYAQSIQAAILPPESLLQQISPNFFLLVKPCELVSGDFYWATTFESYQVFCIADCTGHGVPGAFMSILGITALNDIVVRHRVTKPSEILSYLRESVIEALGQNDSNQLHKDGLDMALCVFNTQTRELHYAGAGIPLWIVAPEPIAQSIPLAKCALQANGHALTEIKGDIWPVGVSPLKRPFTNHSISLGLHSVSVYLSTDGFADQLSEVSKEKYKTSRLKRTILENCSLSMPQQKQMLNAEFEAWKGNSYQVDDVAILGITI